MPRTLPFALVLLLGLFAAEAASAQVRVVRKPAPSVGPDEEVVYEDWWVSWALRDDTEATMLGSRFNNLADAQTYARRVLANNHASSPPGSYVYR